MADCLQKEGVIPACTLDFASYRGLVGDRLQDVECKLSQDGQVLGRVVLARPIAVLGEMDVENPVKLVLDAPVAPSDLQKPFWRHVCRQDIVANERLVGTLSPLAPAQCDPADGRKAGKAVGFCQTGIADDSCRSGLA